MQLKKTEHYVSNDGALDLPSGFRRTEVGIIPMDWDVDRVDENASIKTGSRNTQDRTEDGEYPFFVRSQQVERINSYSFDGEAVLTAGDGVGTGKVFHYINGRFDVHQRVYRISNFSDRLNGLYFFYQFSTRFYDRIMSMTAKSSVDSVRMEMIAGMAIPLPPPCEQRAIAEALSDVDELLTALEVLIAKKQAIKQATMQQLLTGRIRLPGFSRKWETKSFNEVLDRLNAKMHQIPTSEYQAVGRYPVIDQGKDQIVGYSDCTERVFNSPDSGVIVFGDHTCIIKFVDFDFVIGADGTQLISAKNGQSARFYAYLLQHKGVEPTGYNRHFKFLKERIFLVPPFDEQTAIATVLSSNMDSEIAALEARLNKTRAIKQGMVQQLLTGRIRLVKPQTEEAKA